MVMCALNWECTYAVGTIESHRANQCKVEWKQKSLRREICSFVCENERQEWEKNTQHQCRRQIRWPKRTVSIGFWKQQPFTLYRTMGRGVYCCVRCGCYGFWSFSLSLSLSNRRTQFGGHNDGPCVSSSPIWPRLFTIYIALHWITWKMLSHREFYRSPENSFNTHEHIHTHTRLAV